jgi:hypothetical protein
VDFFNAFFLYSRFLIYFLIVIKSILSGLENLNAFGIWEHHYGQEAFKK